MSQEQYTTKSKKCKHIIYAEREIIERQLDLNQSKRKIAELLGRDLSTIKREIKRGSVKQKKRNPYQSKKIDSPETIEYYKYYADYAQKVYEQNRSKCGAKCKFVECKDFVHYAEQKMKIEKQSPDAIVGEAKEKKLFPNIVSTQTLYNWIALGLLSVKSIDLLQKVSRKPRKNKKTERKKVLGKSISERPEVINQVLRFGDWEGDSIVGKNGKSSALTFVERLTGQALVLKTEAKTAAATVNTLRKLKENDPTLFAQMFKSITVDNGAEFSASKDLEELGIEIYYAHPYSAWERGKNEHFNGLIRRFIPKGKDISILSQDDLNRFANYINTMPRKKLNYKTPNELFFRQLYGII